MSVRSVWTEHVMWIFQCPHVSHSCRSVYVRSCACREWFFLVFVCGIQATGQTPSGLSHVSCWLYQVL